MADELDHLREIARRANDPRVPEAVRVDLLKRVEYELERQYERRMYEMGNMVAAPPPITRMLLRDFYEPAKPTIDPAKLEALKCVEPRKVEARVPDLCEVITAWRAWSLVCDQGGWRLKALGRSEVWPPRARLDAACGTGAKQHPAPAWKCQCGVWAFKSLDNLVAAIGTKYANTKVLGTVSLWGRVIETENGYRAQYAYPAELWLLDDAPEDLGRVYDVPVRKQV
ncbi:MAG: hypothetical protein M3348_01690 [Acidobacteriota bacterium]|nr:hypothetical protein [Acidobacteriota bacterium]